MDEKDLKPSELEDEIVDDEPEEVHEEPPKTVREAIRAAVREHSEPKDEEELPKEQEDKKDKAVQNKEILNQLRSTEKEPQEKTKEITKEGIKKDSPKPEDDGSNIEPPPFWKNKGKSTWDSLSKLQKESLVQREQEVSRGFAQYGAVAREYEQLYKVIEPNLPAIQQFGVTPAQTIDRLFGWMRALANNDPSHRVNAFKALAQSFRIPLEQLGIDQTNESDIPSQQTQVQSNQPPSWAHELAARQQQLQQQLHDQNEAAAYNILNNWAKDKPHYSKVKGLMGSLISSGTIPMNQDGSLPLDEAYRQAIDSHPEVKAQIRKDEEEKAKKAEDEKAKKDAQLAAARLARAKKAGASIKPSSPMAVSGNVGQSSRPNGAARPAAKSVRESIKETLDELRS